MALSRLTKGVVGGCFTRNTRIAFGNGGDHSSYVSRILQTNPASATARIAFLIALHERKKGSRLDILIEFMGHSNLGPEVADRKGLIAPVKLGGEILKGCAIFNLPLDD